jgi:DNA-binding SARP family transcriptional activator
MDEPAAQAPSFAAPPQGRFHLRCWGEFALFEEPQAAERSPRGRKARALLAYLVIEGPAPVSRERLAALLWSERGDQQARGSLRQTLSELRSDAGGLSDLVIVERDHVHLAPAAISTDVAQLEALAAGENIAALAAGLANLREPLFGGLDGLDPAFDEWLALQRGLAKDRLLSLGAAAGKRGLEAGAYEPVSRLASALQALEPTDESIAQLGMQADAWVGDLGAVRRRGHRLREAMHRELGVGPSPETEAMFAQLTSGRAPTDQRTATETRAAPARARDMAARTPNWLRRWPSGAGRTMRRRSSAAIAGSLLALIAAGLGWRLLQQAPGLAPPSRLAVLPFTALEPDAAAKDFSARLGARTTGLLEDKVVGLSVLEAPPAEVVRKATLRLAGSVARDGEVWRVRTTLDDPRGDVTLWTREFSAPASQEPRLEQEVAGAVAETVDDAVDDLREKSARRDPGVLALLLQAQQAIKTGAGGDPQRLLEAAEVRAPDVAGVHSHLALVLLGESDGGAPSERQGLEARAEREARTAIRINAAAAGGAYDTLYLLARQRAPQNLAAAEDILIDGARKAPQFPYLPMRRCSFLAEVGLARQGLAYCSRALALRPAASPLGHRYAEALYAMGLPDLAAKAAHEAATLHPEHIETRRILFELAAFSGRPQDASALLHEPVDFKPCCTYPVTAEGVAAMDLFLAARTSGRRSDADKAIAALSAAVRDAKLHPRYLVFGATALNRLDVAFAVLDEISKLPTLMLASDPGFLFDGAAASLWRDARFWPLAEKAGYVGYWRARNVWPDFCSDPTTAYDCRTGAPRVRSSARR